MSVAGWAAHNADQLAEREDTVTWTGYLATSDFWSRTFQNWQSEMLAVGSFPVLAVYLRQRGSPESKPVGAAHADTGETGETWAAPVPLTPDRLDDPVTPDSSTPRREGARDTAA